MKHAASLLLLITIASCDEPGPPQPAVTPRIVVCATVYPLGDVVREIGGDSVRVDWILDLGDPLTGFTAGGAERDRLMSADLMLCEGLRSDAWAAQAVTAMRDTARIVSLDQLPVTRTCPATGYLWLDPAVIRELAPLLAEKLATRIPAQRQTFYDRSNQLVQRINTMLREHPDRVFGRDEVIVLTHAFDVILDRFGVVGRLVEANPYNPAEDEVRRIRREAQERGIKAILLPFDLPGGAVRDIELRTGLRAYLIDQLGVPRLPGHGTYMEILDHNITQLEAASHGEAIRSLE